MDGFTSFNYETLEGFFGRNYTDYIRRLEASGLLECDHSYQPGVKTKRYRASLNNLVAVTFKNKPLAKKVRRRSNMKMQETKERARQMNREQAVDWMINVIETKMGFDEFGSGKVIDKMEPETDKEWLQYHYSVMAVDAILDRRFVYHLCPRSGRFFSNLTNLPKELRRFVLMDGIGLVDVDIATAQPYLLSTLYPERNSEWEMFLRDVTEHDFYKRFAPDVERDVAKKQVYTYILFGENRIAKYGTLWEPFSKRYPILADVIWQMKEKDHASVALHLQSKEADGMIGGVATELAKKQIPFFTIHDGLLLKNFHAARAKEAIIRHFTPIVGIEPKIKITGETK